MPLPPLSPLPSPSGAPWSALEAIAGPCAVTAIWREHLGDTYDAFAPAYLKPLPETVRSFPCPSECGCWHRVQPGDNGTFIGHCRCRNSTCAPLTITRLDVTPFELKRLKLARELCRALHIDSKPSEFPFYNTLQIGSWSADNVPALFTIQGERQALRALISEAAIRFQKPYILLAPTASSLDGQSQQLLANAKAAFFALDTTVILAEDGTIHSIKAPGDLFAQFIPKPGQFPGESTAFETLALARALNAQHPYRKAPLITVFLLRAEGRTVEQIATACDCVRSVVFTRLKFLRQKLGRDPLDFLQYSPQFERIEESLSDPKARKTYRKGATHGSDDPAHQT
jgi:hypothetical protein